MSTAIGVTTATTVMFGIRLESRSTGHLIALDTGLGFHRGVGLGWMMRRGDLRPFTMGVGRNCAADGAGCPVRFTCGLFMRRRSSRGWARLRRAVLPFRLA